MILELLAPAGNLEKLKIAILYGAEAVYIAGQLFSLRKAANNFTEQDLIQALSFAHHHHRKVYVTVNAFLHERETGPLIDYLKILQYIKPDALICSDLGVVDLALKHTTIPIHISTQASVINHYHAQIWKDLGVKRIVAGRELSIAEAAKIKEKTNLEIEMFVHGAMCMAYSGHCSMSTYVAGRDSNRGGCIQNCRYLYSLDTDSSVLGESFLLSSKDLCGLKLIDQFVNHGIDSLKIEGRMKSNLYIATTVRAYAHAISEYEKNNVFQMEKWYEELKKVPYRGYTEGSLVCDADSKSIFNQHQEHGHDFKLAGTVIEIDREKNRFAFQVKNKLKPGDLLEILPFLGDSITIEIKELRDLDGENLKVAQPHNIVWLPWQSRIEISNVARIQDM